MTVSSEQSFIEYNGDGATQTFSVPFYFILNSDISVTVADAAGNLDELTYGVEFSASGGGNPDGGTATLNTAYASGYTILIYRNPPETQETAYYENGKFPAKSHEKALDKLTMLIQKYGWWFDSLALKKPSYLAQYYDAQGNRIANLADPVNAQDAATKQYTDAGFGKTLRTPEAIPSLPAALERANKLVSFNNLGDPIVVLPQSGSASEVMTLLAGSDGLKYIGRCPSVTSLRTTEPTVNKQMISLVEYTVGTGYGGGILWYDNTDTTSADNGVNTFVTAGGKRWKRLNSSVPTLIDAGGVPNISTDSSAALTRLVAVGNAGHIPAGSFSVKGVIISRTDYTLTCSGMLYLGVRASTSENNGGVPAFVGIVLQDCSGVSLQTRWNGQRTLQPAEEHIYCVGVAGGSQLDIDIDAQEVAGDAIYVSQSNWLASSTIASHVKINARVRNSAISGRNAVSIISLDNFSIRVDCKNVGGLINSVQQPGGCDLEPNQTYQTITNGSVEVIADNCAFGFCIFGKSYNVNNVKVKAVLSNNCKPYLTRFKNCDIDIQNKDGGVAAEIDTCLDSKIRLRHYNCTSGAIYGFNGQVLRCDIETIGIQWKDSVAGHYDIQSCTFKVVAQDCLGTGSGFAWIIGIPNGQTSAYVPAYNRYSIDCPRQTNAVYAIRNASNLTLSRCILSNSNLGGWNNWGEAVLGQVANVIESTVCNTLSSSNAIPTSGYYPQGVVVRANSNTVTTGFVLYGWLRLTTGNAHVLDTDWKAVKFSW